jgi:glycine hydroxymethyltransferase
MKKDFLTPLQTADPIVFDLVQKEKNRQNTCLEMIPSESFPSMAVLNALGTVLNNKYSEGYPGKRYYGGNEFVDQIEQLAIDRAKLLFNAEHANVQSYSGSPANAQVYFSVLNIGDKILGMSLADGGHLTHGHKVNFSGKTYEFAHYGVNKETERIDMEKVRRIALEFKPKMIVCGASAYPRIVDFKAFGEIAREVGAYAFADVSHIAGMIVAGAHPAPFPHMDIVMTTTHKTLCGPRGAMILCKKDDPYREKYHPKSKMTLARRVDKAVFPGLQGGPHNHAIAAKAVAFGEALTPAYKEWAHQVVKNAQALAETLIEQGLRVVSGGTDNHLMLVDLSKLGITGGEAETALDKAGITINKNAIPFDPRGPNDPSGIRIGTPALTCRGMGEEEMKQIGLWIAEVVKNPNDATISSVKQKVLDMTNRFPMYS